MRIQDFEDYQFFQAIEKLTKPISDRRRKWISDSLSAYSVSQLSADRVSLGPVPKDALGSLCWLLAVYYDLPAEFDYIRSQHLNKVRKQGASNKWTGHWGVLRRIEILTEDEPFDLTSIVYEVLLQCFSREDIYGNIVPRVAKIVGFFRTTETSLVYFKGKAKPKPRRMKQKRGYDDKGHRVPLHEKHGIAPVKNSEPNEFLENFEEMYPSTVPTNYMWLKIKPKRGTDH